jgi:hypothetical protein
MEGQPRGGRASAIQVRAGCGSVVERVVCAVYVLYREASVGRVQYCSRSIETDVLDSRVCEHERSSFFHEVFMLYMHNMCMYNMCMCMYSGCGYTLLHARLRASLVALHAPS